MNIWKTSEAIAKFGKTFTDEELAKTDTPINEKNLFRILSYMRYLGLLTEKREKRSVGDKQIPVQVWSQTGEKDVQDYYFFLQDKRHEEAKKKLKNILEKHDLFQSIKNDLLVPQKIVTDVDLRDYLRRHVPNKSAQYYRLGANFVIDFLSSYDLIKKEDNKIKLPDSIEKQVDIITKFSEDVRDVEIRNAANKERALSEEPDFKIGEIKIFMPKTMKNLELLKRIIPVIEFEIIETEKKDIKSK